MLARRIAFWALLAIVPAPLAYARDSAPALPRASILRIEQAVAAGMSRTRIPGLSVAVGLNADVVWSAGFGTADVENSIPATDSTMYRVASISKPITAAAVMQLVEQHKIDLDAPVQRYVPEFPRKQWRVTVRELLAHLAGIRHYRDPQEIDSTRHYTDMLEPLGIFKNDPLLFEPGTRFSYSTYGYVLLGAAVERASGMRFADYLRDRIFRPAQMDHIRVDSVYDIIPHRARGYRIGPGRMLENCALADTSNKIAGGGFVSTPADMVKFALAVDRGVLVNRESAGQMFSAQRLPDGRQSSYGLGWSVYPRRGETWVGHNGSQQGVSTFLLLAPKREVSVAVMANLEGLDLSALAAEILRVALDGVSASADGQTVRGQGR